MALYVGHCSIAKRQFIFGVSRRKCCTILASFLHGNRNAVWYYFNYIIFKEANPWVRLMTHIWVTVMCFALWPLDRKFWTIIYVEIDKLFERSTANRWKNCGFDETSIKFGLQINHALAMIFSYKRIQLCICLWNSPYIFLQIVSSIVKHACKSRSAWIQSFYFHCKGQPL